MTESTESTENAVVRRRVVVDAPIERAFEVFTRRFGDIKPPEHTLLAAPIAETVFEPRVGGHIYDRAVDGSEHRHLDRHGPGWQGVRDGVAEDEGWPLYPDRHAAAVLTGLIDPVPAPAREGR
jgi:hypothetical protein